MSGFSYSNVYIKLVTLKLTSSIINVFCTLDLLNQHIINPASVTKRKPTSFMIVTKAFPSTEITCHIKVNQAHFQLIGRWYVTVSSAHW